MRYLKIKVQGKVQGVFYRQSTKMIAEQEGLIGWVRNLPDGSVEIRVAGEWEILLRFIGWCNKGPDSAFVRELEITQLPVSEIDFKTFEIR